MFQRNLPVTHHVSELHRITNWLTVHVDRAFLQGITLGVIAFAIPVLWNTVSEINGRISKHPKRHPITILQNINYTKIQNSFIKLIMVPSVALAFLGLAIFPILPEPFSLVLECLVAVWFLLLLWSVKAIYNSNDADLLKYVKTGDLADNDYQTILSLVWESTDVAVQDEYFTSIDEVYLALYERLDSEVQAKNYEVVNALYRPFIDSFDKRTVLFSLKIRNLASKVLDFNLKVWSSRTKTSNLEVTALVYTLEVALRNMLDFYIKFNESDDFFYALEKHISSLIEDDKNDDYLDRLFRLYGDLILDKLAEQDQAKALELRAFPQNWRITNENLEESKPIGKITRTWNSIFINWAKGRVYDGWKENDYALDKVFNYLYPAIDPPTFSKTLTYLLNPYEKSTERVNHLLTTRISFGFSSHMVGGSFGMGKDAFRNLEDKLITDRAIHTENAYKYFFDYYRIQRSLKLKTIENDIKVLEAQLVEKGADEDAVFHINFWLKHLNELKERYPKKAKK